MDYELELKVEQLENMIHVYEEHIDALEKAVSYTHLTLPTKA